MGYNIIIASVAELDIQAAHKDYNKKLEGLGDEFENEINQSIHYIEQEAQTIQVRYDNIRICFLKRFPFGIHFQMTENNVLIVGIYAMKDNPNKWTKQLY